MTVLILKSAIAALYGEYTLKKGLGLSTKTVVESYIESALTIGLLALNESLGIGLIFAFIAGGLIIGSFIACCVCCCGCCQCCNPKTDNQTIRYFSKTRSSQLETSSSFQND